MNAKQESHPIVSWVHLQSLDCGRHGPVGYSCLSEPCITRLFASLVSLGFVLGCLRSALRPPAHSNEVIPAPELRAVITLHVFPCVHFPFFVNPQLCTHTHRGSGRFLQPGTRRVFPIINPIHSLLATTAARIYGTADRAPTPKPNREAKFSFNENLNHADMAGSCQSSTHPLCCRRIQAYQGPLTFWLRVWTARLFYVFFPAPKYVWI